MGKQIAINVIIDHVLDGIVTAQNEYVKMSGGLWLWNAPEYLITVNVAQSLLKCDGTLYVTLENSVYNALKDAGGIGKGILQYDMRHNGKMDLLIWYAKNDPRGIIEIKNQISGYDPIISDIKRIKAMLIKDSTMQFGLSCFYDSAAKNDKKSAFEKVNTKFQKVLELAITELGEAFEVKQFTKGPFDIDGDAFGACCIFIKKKSSNNGE